MDGQGNLAASITDSAAYGLLFLPSDASAGFVVADDLHNQARVIARRVGFFIDKHIMWNPDGTPLDGEWLSPVTPDAMADGSATLVDGYHQGSLPSSIVPDPRGGYVEERWRLGSSVDGPTHTFAIRWVDAALNPRGPWWTVTSWIVYPPGDGVDATVDAAGNALVVQYTSSRGVPCAGISGVNAFWVLEDGSVSPFAPRVPSYTVPPPYSQCGPRPTVLGSPLVMDEGGIAFFAPEYEAVQVSPSGWYAWYASGSTDSTPPSWLAARDWSLRRLASGAYLAVRRDPTTCTRTAEILGPQGQTCATVALEGSDDCAASDDIFGDGTLILQGGSPCSLVWWPDLGRTDDGPPQGR